MGFGFPAAIGAKIANPKKPVVCITGDGGFQMNIQEMATAVTQGTGITICLLNNNYLGMVRQMQELFYGKRVVMFLPKFNCKSFSEPLGLGSPTMIPIRLLSI